MFALAVFLSSSSACEFCPSSALCLFLKDGSIQKTSLEFNHQKSTRSHKEKVLKFYYHAQCPFCLSDVLQWTVRCLHANANQRQPSFSDQRLHNLWSGVQDGGILGRKFLWTSNAPLTYSMTHLNSKWRWQAKSNHMMLKKHTSTYLFWKYIIMTLSAFITFSKLISRLVSFRLLPSIVWIRDETVSKMYIPVQFKSINIH